MVFLFFSLRLPKVALQNYGLTFIIIREVVNFVRTGDDGKTLIKTVDCYSLHAVRMSYLWLEENL